jgi:hypothetical protein
MLKRIFRPKRVRIPGKNLCNKELCNLYFSPHTTSEVKSWKMGLVVCMKEKRSSYKTFVGKPERKTYA